MFALRSPLTCGRICPSRVPSYVPHHMCPQMPYHVCPHMPHHMCSHMPSLMCPHMPYHMCPHMHSFICLYMYCRFVASISLRSIRTYTLLLHLCKTTANGRNLLYKYVKKNASYSPQSYTVQYVDLFKYNVALSKNLFIYSFKNR